MLSNGVFIFSLIIFIFCSHQVSAEQIDGANSSLPSVSEKAEDLDQFYMCKKDKNFRWLRAYKLDNGKCKALYSKEGYLQVISSATYFSSCEAVLLSVKKNLEEGGFKCTLMPKASVIEIEP